MKDRSVSRVAGVTLLELTFAMAIMALAFGIAARAMLANYVGLDLQSRRSKAAQHCRSVMGAIREVRDQSGDEFVTAVPAWAAEQESGEPEEAYGDIVDLMEQEWITVTCTDLSGGPPADPMMVTVTSSFPDMRGRTATMNVISVLTQTQ